VLRRIPGPKYEQVTEQLGELLNKMLHNLCASPNKIRVITSRRKLATFARNMKKRAEKCSQQIGSDRFIHTEINGRMMLKFISIMSAIRRRAM
jgi:hypothetical protein